MKKRLLASFLSLVLILGLLPTAALATDATSGTCGATGNESSVTWKLVQNSTGSDPATYTLYIEGTGAMQSYAANANSGTLAPWKDYYARITRVEIGEGVTSIGSNAFRNAYGSYTFYLSSTVQTIEEYALYHCWVDAFEVAESSSYFKAVNGVLFSANGKKLVCYPSNKTDSSYAVPDGVEEICDYAFRNPFHLKNVTFPDSLTTIGKEAFRGHSMSAIQIESNSITTIKDLAFGDEWNSCKTVLTEIHLDMPNLTTLGGSDGSAIYGAEGITEAYLNIPSIPDRFLSAQNNTTKLTALSFGSAVQSIGSSAFHSQSSLSVLDLRGTKSNLAIGANAFNGCSSLVAVLMPAGLSSVGTGAFTSGTTIYFDSVTDLEKLTNTDQSYVKDETVLAVVNGGTFADDTSFTSGTLATPTKEGYEFAGWYSDSNFSGNAVTSVTAGQTCYAKWVSKITFDANGGTLEATDPITVEEGKAISTVSEGYTLPTPTGGNGTFVGWNTAADGSGDPVTTATVPTGDMTIYAIWGTAAGESGYSIYPIEEQTYTGSPLTPPVYVVDSNGNKNIVTAVAYENNTNAGTAKANVTISGQVYSVNFTINKATPVISISADKTSPISGGGTVKLTVSDAPTTEGTVSVTCNDESVEVTKNTDGSFSVALPNETKEYTFTATYTAAEGGNYNNAEEATCTVSVTRYTSTGGGGGGTSTYTVSPPSSTTGGDVSVSPSRASYGSTVTITVDPDDGYELDELAVIDANGDEISVRSRGNNQYTFTMPRSRVTIEATFAEIVEEPAIVFVDVPASEYYYDAVYWAVANGVTNGTTAATFTPERTVTRAEMVTFLWRAHGSPAPRSSVNPFTDVTSDMYYYDAVLWAVENGVTNGTSATTFSPDATVTRAQAVTFQWRAAGSPAVSGGSFADVADGAYYVGSVAWAVSNGITNGTGGNNFSPDVGVSRAQAVTFLYRQLG